MRIRRAAVTLAFGIAAAVPLITADSARAAGETCVDQSNGAPLAATKVGTAGADIFSSTASNPQFRITSGDVIVTREGNDTVVVDSTLYDLVICLGDGQDRITYAGPPTTPNNAPGPFSIQAGNGNDTLRGSAATDFLNGGAGASDFADAQPFTDSDRCWNIESSVGCEISNFPLPA